MLWLDKAHLMYKKSLSFVPTFEYEEKQTDKKLDDVCVFVGEMQDICYTIPLGFG